MSSGNIGRTQPSILQGRRDKSAVITETSERRQIIESLNATSCNQHRFGRSVPHALQYLEIQTQPHPDAFQIQDDECACSGVDSSPRDGLRRCGRLNGAPVRHGGSSPQVEAEHHTLGFHGFADGLEIGKGAKALQPDHDARSVIRDRLPRRSIGVNPCVYPEWRTGSGENRELFMLRTLFKDGIQIGNVDRRHAKCLDVGASEGIGISSADGRSGDPPDRLIGVSMATPCAHRPSSAQIDDANYLHG